jgi:RNA methyltransferase, TrmH family
MTTPTSRNNPKIKQVRQLLAQRKERDQTGLFVAEGIRHVGEAVEAHAGVEYICYAPELLTSEFANRLIQEQSKLGVSCLTLDEDTFASLAGKENPQGILAVVRKPKKSLTGLSASNFKWGVALVAPQDPGNIGSILRTIDAVGAGGLLLLDDRENNQYCTDPYHPSSVRASMGSIFWYPPITAEFSEFQSWVRANRVMVYGTSAHASQDYRQVKGFKQPLVLLMGSEREGLTPSRAAACDVMLKLPMRGRVTSLNLAIATGVMLYTILDRLE